MTSGPATSDAATATLRVHIGISGGPAPGVRDEDQPAYPVTVLGGSGRSRTTSTGADGFAVFTLAPGRYTVRPKNGPHSRRVDLPAHRTTTVRIVYAVP